jgi:hypothetical protein
MAIPNKPLRVALIVAGALAALAIVAVAALNVVFRVRYAGFYANARREFPIPGLSGGFVPQGLAPAAGGGWLVSGYMGDGAASRVYLIPQTGRPKRVLLSGADGAPSDSHAGGVASYGDSIYVADTFRGVAIYSAEDFNAAADGASIPLRASFPVGFDAAFVYVSGGTLYVGEFYEATDYPTAPSHHVTTPAGDANFAVIAAYPLSEGAVFGIASGTPSFVYSIPALVQGMCMTGDGRLCLSTSWATDDSHIYIYEDPAAAGAAPPAASLLHEGAAVPLYCLDGANLTEAITLFPMAEEIVCADGRLYIMCESASNKYFFGKLTGNTDAYSYGLAPP